MSTSRRAGALTGMAKVQNLAFSIMVALGFWGMTIFFLALYTEDANHYLYAGIAGLTAAGWTFLVMRRWLAYRQRT